MSLARSAICEHGTPLLKCATCEPAIPKSQKPGWARAELEPIGLRVVIETVAQAFGYPVPLLYSRKRDDPREVTARQIAAYLCREVTGASWPRIGRALRRDHVTCMHSHDVISARLTTDKSLQAIVENLRSVLAQRDLGTADE